jgi:DNA-binding response OmpR family regulator
MARILLIDDDDALRGVIAQNLILAGHTVIEAADGRQGVDLFHATPVDLVLTDLVMPGKEGVETIIELHGENPDLPIIAMSGGMPRSSMYLDIAAKLGARRALAKPFTPQDLLKAIDEVLKEPPPKRPGKA